MIAFPFERFGLSQQLRRFLLTGVLNTAVHTLIAVLFIAVAGADPAFSNVVAFGVATTVSYLVNTIWSFTTRLSRASFTRFLLVSLLGAIITLVVARTADVLGAHYLLGIGLVACTVAPITFTLHKYWTYR